MRAKYSNTFYVVLLFAFLLGGCSTAGTVKYSPLKQPIDISQESLALLTVKISNKYKPDYQPRIKAAFVWQVDEGKNEKYIFAFDEEYKKIEKEYNEYLMGFQLRPGRYKLRELYAMAGINPFSTEFRIPIYSTFIMGPNKIVYLGHIETTIKERTKDDESHAGTIVPTVSSLITASVHGGMGGTFVIEIKDLFRSDLEIFKKQYPYLVNCTIENKALPPWKTPSEKDME